jgi:hypothetical protein
MHKRYWRIQGHDGFKTIFETTVEHRLFTNEQIQQVLQALAAKAGLTFTEIIGAYSRRRSNISNDLLAVHRDSGHPIYMCGSNPTFTASVVDENGKIIVYPII